jgi:hypothetical protein
MSTIDITNIQIASLISDTRVESSYEIEPEAGQRSTVILVEFPTVDDLMLQGMKNVAASIRFTDVSYVSFQDKEMVTQLVRVHLPLQRESS